MPGKGKDYQTLKKPGETQGKPRKEDPTCRGGDWETGIRGKRKKTVREKLRGRPGNRQVECPKRLLLGHQKRKNPKNHARGAPMVLEKAAGSLRARGAPNDGQVVKKKKNEERNHAGKKFELQWRKPSKGSERNTKHRKGKI